jgi:hypothetical protein
LKYLRSFAKPILTEGWFAPMFSAALDTLPVLKTSSKRIMSFRSTSMEGYLYSVFAIVLISFIA